MALKYVRRKRGVLDTDTGEIITPVKTIKWRIYELWLRRFHRNNPMIPKGIFNS